MKSFLSYLFKKKFVLFSILISSFLLGFLLCDIYNSYHAYYECHFEVENVETFDVEKLNDVTYLNEIKQSGYNVTTKSNKYENIAVEKMLKNHDFIFMQDGNKFVIKTAYKYYDIFFISSSKSLGTRAKMFIKDAVMGLIDDSNFVVFEDATNIVKVYQYHNKISIGFYSLLVGGVISLLVFAILFYQHKESIEFVYDNETTFQTVLHKKYWKEAIKPLKKTKDMTTLAMLFALLLASKFIALPSGFGNLGLSVGYLFFAIIGMIYGPIYGIIIGILSDTIGFIIKPEGFFFLGYTLQAALTGFTYGICFYKTKVNFSKILLARIIVNLLLNTLWGSMCYGWVFTELQGREYVSFVTSYITLLALPKNLVYLLPQTMVLFLVMKAISPILYHFKLMDSKVYQHLKLLN